MRVDGYTKVIFTVAAVALVALAGRAWLDAAPWGEALRVTAAEAQGRPPEYDITIPKARGRAVFYGSGNFVFEDADGVMREVDVRSRSPEYPKIKSLVRRGE